MTLSWIPYCAVIIIAVMAMMHYLKTYKSYSEGIAVSILLCHGACIGLLWLFAGSRPLDFWSLVWLGGFLLASIASSVVSGVDEKKRSVLPGTHAYAAKDGFAALLFVVSAKALVLFFS